MSQKLSFHSIAATLAALSATGLLACGGATPPADSPADVKEVPAAAAADATPPATDATSATAASDAKPADAKPADAPAAAADAKPADAPAAAADAKPADAKAADKPKTGKKKAAGAKSGCGAGTCG
ncbi:MAG TPA: hypothetical protein VGI10_09680 [Polyangiaceae bacterium]|jgi:hypothetical protein